MLVMRALDLLRWGWDGGAFDRRCHLGVGAVSTRAVRQLNAQRGQRQRLPASVVGHRDCVACIVGDSSGLGCRRGAVV